ncbi:MAG: hypothetical protein KJO65_10920 [Gemmatimonadetes bacterium]|nr:hypothetical protein [Gemmatimonadota bacterium]
MTAPPFARSLATFEAAVAGAVLVVVMAAVGAVPGTWNEGPAEGVHAQETSAATASGPVRFHYDLHTFKGADDGTTVVAAVAVPVRELRRERFEGDVRYRFDIRFVLADTSEQRVIDTIDSVYVSVPSPLARRHLLHTTVELDAEPSTSTWQRLVVTDAGRPGYGQLEQSGFTIPDYSGNDLMLSDIAFGLPGSRGGWQRRNVTLALLPTSQFPESAFDLYYEIYNLPPGRGYETELAIRRLDDDDDDRTVRTLFQGESAAGPDGIIGELRRVESSLDNGRYEVTVTVTDRVDGRQATSSRVVEVQGWRRGTTMVPALPKRGTIVEGR